MLTCLGAKIISFDKKYTIFSEGSPAKYIGIMLSGSAQIFQVDYNGNRNILSSIETGEVFAEAFACAEIESLPVTIIANEPSEVMLIDSNRVLYTCSKNCDFHRHSSLLTLCDKGSAMYFHIYSLLIAYIQQIPTKGPSPTVFQ